MSGIVAVVNYDGAPVDPQVLKKMAEQCAYRGPDGIHYWIEGNVGLAHLALHATPEALREHQPLRSEDGQLCLTADVRVDNRPELIPLLQTKGEAVSSESTDADLILAAYRIWGEGCPEQLVGDYAFAIWDAKEQRLFCARDALGIKSLHYALVGATLCVASEAQLILQHPSVPRRLDEVTVADYLVDNLHDETRTMFMDVHKLAPAHLLIADPTGMEIKRYWDIDPHFQTIHQNDNEYAAHFLEIFQRAVADRLRTPGGTSIGITMSGGLDSTSVAAVAQKIINSQSGQPPLLACSYAFEQLKECDESDYSRAMADELGIELNYIPAENFWLLDNDEAFTPSLETPFMAEESLTRHTLSIFNQRGARVWLTGHGGDKVVEGSPLIYADHVRRGDFSAFLEIARHFRRFNLSISSLLLAYREWVLKPLAPEEARQLYRSLKRSPVPNWLDAGFARRNQIAERLMCPTIPKYFPDYARQANYVQMIALGGVGRAVCWQDRIAALYHMEARHPFLDRRLVEYVLSITPEQIFRVGQPKFILRMAMRGILPKIVLTRLWKTSLKDYFELGILLKETSKIQILLGTSLLAKENMVNSNEFKRYIKFGGNEIDVKSLWSVLTLELWFRKNNPLLTGNISWKDKELEGLP